MLRTALSAAILGSLTAIPTATLAAVSDAEFKALQEQLNTLADQVDNNSRSASNTQVGGYGEMHYNNVETSTGRNKQIDFERFILFVDHQFSDSIRFISETEIEHSIAGEGQNGEIEIEQAYIQMDLNDSTQLNAGLFMLPVGIINESHEPNIFYGVERNPVEQYIVPATWWEGGTMLSGNFASGISYDLAVHSGLAVDPAQVNIRGGRQKVSEAKANNWAMTGRVRYTGIAGLELSGTLQLQDDITQNSSDNVGGATLLETHVVWNSGPTTVKALYARWNIDGSAAKALSKDVQDGGYVEAAYKLNANHGVFARHNVWDNGGAGNTKKTQSNIGYSYWPHEDVVFKADYQTQESNNVKYNGFNLGVGYQF